MGQTKKPHENLQLGFDRTQLFKEWVQPQINRSSSLTTTVEYCRINKIHLSVKETIAMSKRFEEYIETGNTSWMEKMDDYLEKKKILV
jgi:hypothetical protein